MMQVLARILVPLRRHWRSAAIVLLCAAAGLVQARSTADDNRADPPSRVARLSYLSGDLGFLPAGAQSWSDASINRPLTTGDRLSSGAGSRAELELGGGTLRIDGKTDFGVLDLTDQVAQIELTQGTLRLAVRHLDPGQSYEIDTPTVALVVDQPGTFRVDIDRDGQATQVTAFDGSATVYGENNAQRPVRSGRSYRFSDASLAAVEISDIGDGDDFDAWSDRRDQRYARSITRRYVSDDVVGYQDLDQYGDWQDTSDYGAVWYPAHEAADWAPYRDGHWAYIAPWGWSWVDDSPWGFAPYHYGRWAYTRRGWGWIPGPREEQAIYAPALVAFVGGGGWSVGFSSGPVGWFPLGPGEIYNPWYHCDRDYYNRVNVTNIRVTNVYNNTTIINNIDNHYNSYRDNRPIPAERYVNRTAPRGFTAVPGKAFAGGQHVQRDLLRVDPHELAGARVQPRGAELRPLASVAGAARSARVQALPLSGFRREVVARRAPPVMPGEQRIGPASQLAQPVRISATGGNVRMLDPRGEPLRRAEPGRVSPRATDGGPVPTGPRAAADQSPPRVSRLMPAAAAREDARINAPRAGELPSARFAHPLPRGDNGRAGIEQGRPMPLRQAESGNPAPRPGISYIPPAGSGQPSYADRGPRTLPQAPRIERAAPGMPPSSAADSNPRYEAMHGYRSTLAPSGPIHDTMPPRAPHPYENPRGDIGQPSHPMPEPSRPVYQPRFQPQPQSEPPPRFQQPHFQPPPREMQQPRFQPPPREMQQPRYEPQPRPMPPTGPAPRAPQPAARPAAEPRARPARKDDDHQH